MLTALKALFVIPVVATTFFLYLCVDALFVHPTGGLGSLVILFLFVGSLIMAAMIGVSIFLYQRLKKTQDPVKSKQLHDSLLVLLGILNASIIWMYVK